MVAHAGGIFELEVFGVLHHQLFEAFDFFGHIALAHVLDLGFFNLAQFGFFARLFAVHTIDQITHLLEHTARGDAIGFVERNLFGAAAFGFTNGSRHRIGHAVGIQNRFAADVARGAANGLNQAALRAQEAFFVGIQNGHQRHLWQVNAFAQ